MNTFLKIAHRGAKGYEPENTLKAFQKALDLNADGIELDVHLSADGQIIVIHDETIDRMTNGKGLVNALSLSELKSFLIDGQYEIPTLREVFDLVNKKCLINIELKNFETSEKIVTLIEDYIVEKNWNYEHFIVSSFDWNALQKVHDLNSKIQIGVLTEDDLDLALAFAENIQAKAIHPDYLLLNSENVKKMQDKGFLVLPWTVNTEEEIRKIKSYNVDGIISDFPDKI
ncbi:glycerophosphodiester phosphodiesterase family protein [Flavobacterium sp. Fl-77]|uniref:Glycerophosphodiester phosphodiesterase family protein n=1 Tax=Flavobacterium flavipigmentatum TaxID=2893884 RepID=A0AAJ2VVI3_9FLAO|nr:MULTISPECIES: glycerophosphodiester phosphodiesterase family protein [unclassified Flavobacterium]MDX6181286.1 glycerophosphodiester phosphodiesterase family protein [Flavobacterium sp. Fl-33]MDX6184887.1 glycerophosphodiester phosphodiesterase family protein [Flavobacterium sp. Fl-77]UFH39979.1 glycerophosphodiester phosphodiesterase [Flavobacterium sp. F-70]